VLLATYQLRLPDTTRISKSYTAILWYNYSPAYHVTTTMAACSGLKAFMEVGKANRRRSPQQTFPEISVLEQINYNNITQG